MRLAWVSQQATNKDGGFVSLDIQMNQTIPRMAQAALKVIPVKCKESGLLESEQKGDDFVVLHPLSPYLVANVSDRYMPILQKLALDS